MKKASVCIVITALLAVWGWADSKYPIEEKEVVQKTLKFQDASKPGRLRLDNVFGSIKVEAVNGGPVELTAHKTIRAESKDKIRQAKDEVKLDLVENADSIEIYVDGPFRCQCPDGSRGIKSRDMGYEVRYDFVLKVPRRTSVILKTVNDGDIIVTGIEGMFEVGNVNGRVELEGMAGSGEARTVNGGVKVGFTSNPKADCTFTTVNGDVELEFRETPAADFKLKTFNGKAYSDFETKTLPTEAPQVQEKKEGRFRYHSERFTHVRAGKGGPVLYCDTLNGDILIKKRASGK